jgi:GT2 family glycosyltransferase
MPDRPDQEDQQEATVVAYRAALAEAEALRLAARQHDADLSELRNDRALLIDVVRQLRSKHRDLETQLAKLSSAVSEIASAKAETDSKIAEAEAALTSFTSSTSWRITGPARRLSVLLSRILRTSRRTPTVARALLEPDADVRLTTARFLRKLAAHFDPPRPALPAPPKAALVAIQLDEYQQWIRSFDELSPSDRNELQRLVADKSVPSVTVVVLLDPTSAPRAQAAVNSLKAQLFNRWKALLIFDSRCDGKDVDLAREAVLNDPRFLVLQGAADEIQDGGSDALVVIAGSVVLREHALCLLAGAAKDKSECVVYSDEDRLDPSGERLDPFFKPAYSPELWQRTGYAGPCILVRHPDLGVRSALKDLTEGSQSIGPWSLAIAHRMDRRHVMHLPTILYHETAESRAWPIQPVTVGTSDSELPNISIIIPTRDRLDLLKPCLDSIREKTSYPAAKFEIVVVDNGTTDPDTLKYLAQQRALGAIRVLFDPRPFNYSRLNNFAAQNTTFEVLVFLNNDTLVNEPTWLNDIAHYLGQNDVGAVGSKLLYEDRTVQHGGVILGLHGLAAHAHVGAQENEGGYRGLASQNHEIAAVTGACLAMRRNVFHEAGGFDANLEIAFSDVLLCAKILELGYRNIYIGRPLLLHLESRTRGYDDTPEKKQTYLREALYARAQSRSLFREDPYYNPNLSLHQAYGIAFPPRRRKPWRPLDGKPRVMMLSSTCEVGHGVAVVMQLQAEHLVKNGFDVLIGGPKASNEFSFEQCRRIYLHDWGEAANQAVANDVDCIVAHTPPFFSVVRSTGEWPKTIMYDYGEPDPSFFGDADLRREVLLEKRYALAMAHRVYAISQSVKAESQEDRTEVIRLGNSHLASWSSDFGTRRDALRKQLKWEDKIVILNVCRFHKSERAYKGIDRYAEVMAEFALARPTLASRVVFVLCGKATEDDVQEVTGQGLTAFANVSDTQMIDLYAAADIYMNFSCWEGYNLGIGQALAMGLPVIASDIPAHREFGIPTSNDLDETLRLLESLVTARLNKNDLAARKPVIWTWEEPLSQFASAIETLCRENSAGH